MMAGRMAARFGGWRAALAACVLALSPVPALAQKHLAPIPGATLALMAARDTGPAAPILVRTYKKEAELEVWKQNRAGRYVLLKTFPICRWSGQLGPKVRVGDRQAPEGFYAVAPRQMNPNSAYHLSFDVGYPNAFDRQHGRTGSALMVHGTCSSAGCFAMTDGAVSEIFALARDAFAGGQGAFQVQAFPFRMSAAAMARHRQDPNIDFWRQLKAGSDRFEATGREPVVKVAAGRYGFEPYRDPAVEAAALARLAEEDARIATLVAEGSAAVRTTYQDGGMHPTFAVLARHGAPLGEISRPETLAFAGREVIVLAARPRPTMLPPARARDPVARPTELSVFDFVSLGTVAPAGASLPGSTRILPGGLAPLRLALAAP